MDDTTQQLARFAWEADISRLPAAAVHECKRRLIDSIACAAAAYPEPFCVRTRAFAERYSGTPSARIWGSGARTSVEMAAFANGTMLRYLDYSDTYLGKTAGHPSDMLGALVAVAEAFECDGASLVAASVLAYEIYCGLCDSVALQPKGFDQATCAVVGTAAGAGKLLGLTVEQIGHALSLALAPNLHLYNVRCGELSDWKACAGPNGARNGVFAALLARDGFTGPSAVIEGKGGLFDAITPFEWRFGAGDAPLITGTHLKFHPVCYHGQAAIDAAVELRRAVPVDQIADILVETYESAFQGMGADLQRWAPTTRETADHSLPYTIAMTLQDGGLTSQSYAPERLSDPRTRRLMEKIRIVSTPAMTSDYPRKVQARITIRGTDGSVHTHLQTLPKGHAANPLTDAELEEKFLQLYPPFGDADAAGRSLELLWSLEKRDNVASIVDAICMESHS
jgi:2-methylcitrate dehydratase